MAENYGPATPDDPRLITANGITITDGLRVWDYDLERGTVDLAGSRTDGKYWDGWFNVQTDKGRRSLVNGERVVTVHPFTRERA